MPPTHRGRRALRIPTARSASRASDHMQHAERGYKVVTISLYSDQAELVDRTARDLLQAGYVKANRSFVIQTAIQCLRENLESKSSAEILKYFLGRQIKKPLAVSGRRGEDAIQRGMKSETAKGPL
jgi:hypothetical protein